MFLISGLYFHWETLELKVRIQLFGSFVLFQLVCVRSICLAPILAAFGPAFAALSFISFYYLNIFILSAAFGRRKSRACALLLAALRLGHSCSFAAAVFAADCCVCGPRREVRRQDLNYEIELQNILHFGSFETIKWSFCSFPSPTGGPHSFKFCFSWLCAISALSECVGSSSSWMNKSIYGLVQFISQFLTPKHLWTCLLKNILITRIAFHKCRLSFLQSRETGCMFPRGCAIVQMYIWANMHASNI